MQCQTMLGRTWGLSPKITRWAYLSLIRPTMSYGSLIWLKGTFIPSQAKYLVKVQRRACTAILSSMRTTPTKGMEIILNIPPITVFLQTQAVNTYLRLKDNGNWKPRTGEVLHTWNHTCLVENLAKETPTLFMPTDKMINREHIRTNFTTSISTREEMNRTIIVPKPNKPNTINVFTDGSRFDECSGYGYTIHGENIRKNGYSTLGKYATVYQAEVTAIQEATRTLSQQQVVHKNIDFYVDNQAAIQSLGKYEITNKLVLECKLALKALSNNNNVTINWIPGHSGHRGNNVADGLAKMGVKLKVQGPEPIIPISEATRKEELGDWSLIAHQQLWDETTTCRQTKMMIPNIRTNTWKQIKNLSKKNISIITQMLTGHSTLQRHLYIMKIEDSPLCEQCCEDDEEETVEHFLSECPAFATTRYHTLGKLFLKREDLKNLRIQDILNFVNRTKRFE